MNKGISDGTNSEYSATEREGDEVIIGQSKHGETTCHCTQ